MFFPSGHGALTGTFTEVSCSEWSGSDGSPLWNGACIKGESAALWPSGVGCGNQGQCQACAELSTRAWLNRRGCVYRYRPLSDHGRQGVRRRFRRSRSLQCKCKEEFSIQRHSDCRTRGRLRVGKRSDHMRAIRQATTSRASSQAKLDKLTRRHANNKREHSKFRRLCLHLFRNQQFRCPGYTASMFYFAQSPCLLITIRVPSEHPRRS